MRDDAGSSHGFLGGLVMSDAQKPLSQTTDLLKYDRETVANVIQAGLCNNDHEDKCSYPKCQCPALMWQEYRREAQAVIVALETAGYAVTEAGK